jgi:hypothetical protein
MVEESSESGFSGLVDFQDYTTRCLRGVEGPVEKSHIVSNGLASLSSLAVR